MTAISVVGAGVVGLTCALELEAAGHDVTVFAEHTGDAIVSAVAGAIWFPYRAGPPTQVARWARRSRARLEALAVTAPDAGVDLLTCWEINDEQAPWWRDAAPDAVRTPATHLPGQPLAWRLVAPRIEPALFLPWLTARLARPIVRGRIDRLDDVPGDVVVHCAGRGARRLAGDAEVSGLRGQVVIAAPGDVDLAVAIADDRRADALFYLIPRRGLAGPGRLRDRPRRRRRGAGGRRRAHRAHPRRRGAARPADRRGAGGPHRRPPGARRGPARARRPGDPLLWPRRRRLHAGARLRRGRRRARGRLSRAARGGQRAIVQPTASAMSRKMTITSSTALRLLGGPLTSPGAETARLLLVDITA